VRNCRERKERMRRRNYATKPFAVLVTGSYLWQCRFIAIQLCSKVRAFWRFHGKVHAEQTREWRKAICSNNGETSKTLCAVHLHKTFWSHPTWTAKAGESFQGIITIKRQRDKRARIKSYLLWQVNLQPRFIHPVFSKRPPIGHCK